MSSRSLCVCVLAACEIVVAMKRLLNVPETATYTELTAVAEEYGLQVYPKIRVADVLPIEGSGIPADLYRYSLMSHFDFVVYDSDHKPAFAVEFDGPTHLEPEQRERDRKKNELCKRFGLPILRTVTSHISRKYRDMTLLAWIIEVYQLQLSFDEAQSRGQIPYDEPFDPFFLIHSGKPGKRFPYWLSMEAQDAFRRWHEEGKIKFPGTSGFIGYDANQVLRGVEYVQVSDSEGLSTETAMRPQDFPVLFSDLLAELLTIQLHEKVEDYFRGGGELQKMSVIWARVNELRGRLELARAHSIGNPPATRTVTL